MTDFIGLDITAALAADEQEHRPTRFDRFNGWLQSDALFYLGLALCVVLAIALPQWLARSSAALTQGIPGGASELQCGEAGDSGVPGGSSGGQK